MRYVAAFFLPPLATLLCGRLSGTLLNAALYVCAWGMVIVFLPAAIALWLLCALHAMHCADVYAKTQRTREANLMLVAQGHKPIPTPKPFLSGMTGWSVALVLVALALAAVNWAERHVPGGWRSLLRPAEVTATTETAPGAAHPLPILANSTLAEVEQIHGAPLSKDATTGWAVWPRFKAHFVNGHVVEVSR